MNSTFFLFLVFGLISSCNVSKDETKETIEIGANLNQYTEPNHVYKHQNATKEDVAQFFDISSNFDSLNTLYFFENDDSVIWFDDKKSDWVGPISWIGVEGLELQSSKIIISEKFSLMALSNLAETSGSLFYKQNGKEVDRMIENGYYSDSALFHQVNDTLFVCQFYCNYDFGSNLSDIRTYYFIGEKIGFFKYGYSTTGIKLNLEDFVLKDQGILFEDIENRISLLIQPDTIHQLKKPKETKKVSVFKLNYTYFENVAFSE